MAEKNAERRKKDADLSWEYSISLVKDHYILQDLLKAFVVIMTILIVILSIVGVNIVLTLQLSGVAFAVTMGAVLVALAIIGRLDVQFKITESKVEYIAGQRTRKINRILLLLSLPWLVRGNPIATGAAMIAVGSERASWGWNEISEVRVDDQRQVIQLRSRWRTLTRLYCTPETFEQAVRLVKERTEKKAPLPSKPKAQPKPIQIKTLVCPKCGSNLQPDNKFCTRCGAKVEEG